jgi:pilus assembly protein Flp/PilA
MVGGELVMKGSIMSKVIMKHFFNDDSGATSIEYALIAGAIALTIIVSLTNIRTSLQDIFVRVAAGFDS